MRRVRHQVDLREVLASQRHQLVFSRMIDHLVADDACGGQRSVLLDVMPEVGNAGMTARNQHLGDTLHRITNRAEKLMFSANAARVLACEVPMFMDLLLKHLLRIELQYLGGVMVDEDDGVVDGHGDALVR